MKRLLALLLPLTILLCGCSALIEREYSTSSPHSQKYWEADDRSILRAGDPQELVNVILTLIAEHREESTVRLYTETTAVETEALLENACREVREETAPGAYAVDYITYTVADGMGCREVNFNISYRRSAAQYASIVSITGVNAISDVLHGSAAAGKQELVLRTSYFKAEEEDIRALLQELDREQNGENAGSWTVSFYPASGETRIIEFLLPEVTGDAGE